MNPFAVLIAALTTMVAALRAKATESIAKLPPLEQVAGSQEMGYALQRLEWAGESLDGMTKQFESDLADLEKKMNAAVEQRVAEDVMAAMAAKVADGTLIEKATHEAALQSAQGNVSVAVEAALAERDLIDVRRSSVAAELPEGAVAADIGEDFLKADAADFGARLAKFKERKAKVLALNGLTPALSVKVANLPAGDDGDALFGAMHAVLESAAAGAVGARPPMGGTGSGGSTQFAAAQTGADAFSKFEGGN